MGEVEAFRAEIRLRGESTVRAQCVAMIAGLVSGLGTLSFGGRKPAELDVRVVAGALLALRKADLIQASPVLMHLRLALGCMTVRQGGVAITPSSWALLARWVEAVGLGPTVSIELDRQLGILKAAVAGADQEPELH